MKKKEEKKEGAPAWMLTYGDLVTQVLVFFVLLFSMSIIDIKRFREIIGVKEEEPGGNPTEEERFQQLVKQLQKQERSFTNYVSRWGVEIPILRVPEGLKITLEGNAFFKKGSAELDESAIVEKLKNKTVGAVFGAIVELLEGGYNKVEIRGHTDINIEDTYNEDGDFWKLAYDRAKSTMELLIKYDRKLYAKNPRVTEERFKLISYGRNDPVWKDSDRVVEHRKENRRVEIIIIF